jgi:hypothetical protein
MESRLTKFRSSHSNLKRLVPLLILALLVAFVATHRIAASDRPFSKDAAAYSVIGQELLAGRSLYSEVVEIRPPLAMVSFAAGAVFARGANLIVLIYVVGAVLTLLGIYYAGSHSSGGAMAGLWAATFWVALSNLGEIQGGDPNTELFMNLFQVWAFAFLVRLKETSKWQTVVVIGLLFLLSSFTKQLAVIVAAFVIFVYVVFSDGVQSNFIRRLKQAAMIAGIGVAGWLLMFFYFGATGRFAIFKDLLVSNSLDYAAARGVLAVDRSETIKVLLSNTLAPLYGEAEIVPDVMNFLALLTLIGVIIGLIRRHRSSAYIVAFAASTWIELSLSGQFYPHYYQLWLPVFAIGGAWAISEGLELMSGKSLAWVPHAVGGLVLAALLTHAWPWYRMDLAQRWSGMESEDLVAAKPLAREITTILKPDESFYNWGSNPELYVYANRRSPTGVLFVKLLLGGALRNTLSQRVLTDLQRASPELIVSEKAWEQGYEDHQVLRWIALNYELFPENADRGPFRLYVRRGGALQARLLAQSN